MLVNGLQMNPRIFWQISLGSCVGTKAVVTEQGIPTGESMVCLKCLINIKIVDIAYARKAGREV